MIASPAPVRAQFTRSSWWIRRARASSLVQCADALHVASDRGAHLRDLAQRRVDLLRRLDAGSLDPAVDGSLARTRDGAGRAACHEADRSTHHGTLRSTLETRR